MDNLGVPMGSPILGNLHVWHAMVSMLRPTSIPHHAGDFSIVLHDGLLARGLFWWATKLRTRATWKHWMHGSSLRSMSRWSILLPLVTMIPWLFQPCPLLGVSAWEQQKHASTKTQHHYVRRPKKNGRLKWYTFDVQIVKIIIPKSNLAEIIILRSHNSPTWKITVTVSDNHTPGISSPSPCIAASFLVTATVDSNWPWSLSPSPPLASERSHRQVQASKTWQKCRWL